jgi:hypothetical protein
MTRSKRRIAAGLGCGAAVVMALLIRQTDGVAGPREDLKPFAAWAFDADGWKGRAVADRGGKLPATVVGKPNRLTAPAAAVEFVTPADAVSVKKVVTPADPFLPKEAFSVVAWVRVDEPAEWGGILGCLQDNGDAEKGFAVGFGKTGFTFALATEGADDGNGKMTVLTGQTAYDPGRWYHVAATYDGKTMRLFVNGKADGSSAEQSGAVLYADRAPLTIGRYQDANEDYPTRMAIREVLWCDHAVSAERVAAHFRADERLAAAPPPAAGPKFVVEPYLQFGTRTGMTVMCETAVPTTCEVRYGTAFPPDRVAKVDKADTLHEVKLDGLQPNTKHFYQVIVTAADGAVRAGRPGTFFTAVGPADAYSFCVIGDTQKNPAVTGRVAKLMWERRPNFVLHMGDVVDNGPDLAEWTDELFRPCQELFGRVAVYPCIGNHEKNHAHYYKYFSLPKPEYHYAFTYGNAEFFSIDTNKPVGPGSEQYKWLDRALAASKATWKVCYHHHPCYSSDSDDYGSTWEGVSTLGAPEHKPLIGLYEKHRVDLALNGHIHLYERTHPIRGGKVDPKGGVTYLTSGGGGGRLEDFDPAPAFFKNQGRVDYHFVYFTAVGGTLEGKAFDADGRLFDQFTLRKE